MKSIGIAIHLAQVGCYVPATAFEITPYRALFTRILNQDNLWAGLSSFAVEMSEMRDILRSADAWTMVLGDELCAGTESVSAKALVAAGIEWLAERRSSYVFATHLHGLTDVLPEPDTLSLKVWHLKVSTDPAGKLIYHRNLEPGAGSSLYGLEVAKAMDVPMAFLDKAHKIRRKLLGTVADDEAPKSSWNSSVVRRACELCNCALVADLEVHHIKARSDGGSNHVHNLMVLCAACHDRHHADPEGSLASVSLTVTSEGPERLINAAALEKKKKGLTDEENEIVVKELTDYPNLPIKKMVERLKIAHGIKVSEATIRKMR
jgi:DNA mismatch repair protein MutS